MLLPCPYDRFFDKIDLQYSCVYNFIQVHPVYFTLSPVPSMIMASHSARRKAAQRSHQRSKLFSSIPYYLNIERPQIKKDQIKERPDRPIKIVKFELKM